MRHRVDGFGRTQQHPVIVFVWIAAEVVQPRSRSLLLATRLGIHRDKQVADARASPGRLGQAALQPIDGVVESLRGSERFADPHIPLRLRQVLRVEFDQAIDVFDDIDQL